MKGTMLLLCGSLVVMLASVNSCGNKIKKAPDLTAHQVDPSLFLEAGLLLPITTEERALSDGSTALCYKITTTSQPVDHSMGPWCPTNIADSADKGGKWMEGGEIYDVDGEFIKNMASFYNDATWKMYDENGDIYVTSTLDDCKAAANPNVGAEYQNYCVECQPSFVDEIHLTYYIPVTPKKLDSPVYQHRGGQRGDGPPRPDSGGKRPPPQGHGGGNVIGLALNGVNFDPPAPTDVILSAYTLAPLDDSGGHINPNTGYHYHAATGNTTKILQKDGHAPMIGYAIDGFTLHEQLNEDGKEPTDLDECRGHTDDTRGYHYHVAYAGTNSFIGCFAGAQGSFETN